MFLSFFKARVRLHAARVFTQVLGDQYDGEVFLCGGAFKPLLKRKAPVNDMDLWVRDRREREKLTRHLLSRGAVLAREVQPYCLKLRLDGRLIEISYHNVKDASLTDVLNTFDLAICGIGARFEKGGVAEVQVMEECWNAVRRRSIRALPSYLFAVHEWHNPGIILTLHRMGQQASELEFDVDLAHEHLLWEAFWGRYNDDERRIAMEHYFATTASRKGTSEERISRAVINAAGAGSYEPTLTPQVA